MITAKEALSMTKEARLLEVENMIILAISRGKNHILLHNATESILHILEENGYRISEDSVQKGYYVYWE